MSGSQRLRCSSLPNFASGKQDERVHRYAEADREPGAGQLLEHLQVDLVRLRRAAVLLRVGQAEQPGAAQRPEHVAGELAAVLELGCPRLELGGREIADEVEQALRPRRWAATRVDGHQPPIA